MSVEEIIKRILSSCKDVTRDMILHLINKKIQESKGFLTLESAARAVAAEFGLEITGIPLMKGTSIRNLVSGLNDVTIVGRVLHVNPIRTFIKSNGEEGEMRSLHIADGTGMLRVVVWGDLAKDLDFKVIGKIVRFSHGYVREGYGGNLELNIGSKGKVKISPQDISEDNIPSFNKFFKKINQIESETRVNIFGRIMNVFPVKTFVREDKSSGKMRKLEVRDETGKVTVILWNNKVDELADAETGKYLGILGAKVRKDINGRVELHIDRSVDATLLSAPPDLKNLFSSA
ncbi:hypothetical protein DRO35_01675 [Candidatus Bathyarchaeota archaeon]|nr:MAG: hypothetical protein DRO35_01675 [Candidatus Bathyarchaeota archaeon]